MTKARAVFHIFYRLRVDAILLAKILFSRGEVVVATLTSETGFWTQNNATLAGENI